MISQQDGVENLRWHQYPFVSECFPICHSFSHGKSSFLGIADEYLTNVAFTFIFSVPLNFLPWLVASMKTGNMM